MRPENKLGKKGSAQGSRGRHVMAPPREKTMFVGYGEEMIHKQVKRSGASGRIYLPQEWVGKNVKIIRLD